MQQLINALHTVDGLVQVEDYFRDDTQLMALQCAEFTAKTVRVLFNQRHRLCYLVLREDRQINMRKREIRRYAHFAHGYQGTLERARVTQKDVAHIFLYESSNLVLSG